MGIRRKRPRRKVLLAVAVTWALLVPLAVFGAPALATSQQSGSAQYQYKVTLCHHTHSAKHPWVKITVSSAAVAAHMARHGDFVVTATSPCPPAPGAAPTPPTHGNSGNSGNHGNHGHHGHP
jgi:hypothetical protein